MTAAEAEAEALHGSCLLRPPQPPYLLRPPGFPSTSTSTSARTPGVRAAPPLLIWRKLRPLLGLSNTNFTVEAEHTTLGMAGPTRARPHPQACWCWRAKAGWLEKQLLEGAQVQASRGTRCRGSSCCCWMPGLLLPAAAAAAMLLSARSDGRQGACEVSV